MVFLFKSTDGHLIFMGKSGYENEELLENGLQEDVLFCLDCLSTTSHLFLRLKKGEDWTTLRQELIIECTQLIKHNIEIGKERDSVNIIYTPYSNLYKTKEMKLGNAQLFDKFLKKVVKNVVKDKEAVKKLMKTRTSEKPSYFINLKEEDQKQKRWEKFIKIQEQQMIKQMEKQQIHEKQSQERNYSFLDNTSMTSNKSSPSDDLEDFI